jgi:hypothetical protein
MKPPPKPFTVEVKRSRSSLSIAKPVVSEPPAFIEASVAPAPLSLSQARQLAEKMFTSLTVGSSVELETKVTAQSVFRAQTPQAVTAEEPAAEPTTHGLVPPPPPIKEIIQAKPRNPRASTSPRAAKPTDKVAKPKSRDLSAVEAAATPHLARKHQDPDARAADASSPPVSIDPAALNFSAAEVGQQATRQNWGWQPGQRWKKRLRHLR